MVYFRLCDVDLRGQVASHWTEKKKSESRAAILSCGLDSDLDLFVIYFLFFLMTMKLKCLHDLAIQQGVVWPGLLVGIVSLEQTPGTVERRWRATRRRETRRSVLQSHLHIVDRDFCSDSGIVVGYI